MAGYSVRWASRATLPTENASNRRWRKPSSAGRWRCRAPTTASGTGIFRPARCSFQNAGSRCWAIPSRTSSVMLIPGKTSCIQTMGMRSLANWRAIFPARPSSTRLNSACAARTAVTSGFWGEVRPCLTRTARRYAWPARIPTSANAARARRASASKPSSCAPSSNSVRMALFRLICPTASNTPAPPFSA